MTYLRVKPDFNRLVFVAVSTLVLSVVPPRRERVWCAHCRLLSVPGIVLTYVIGPSLNQIHYRKPRVADAAGYTF